MEKVTVNGISDKDIYDDVGKQKSYINISNYHGGDSTMEKIQWKIPRIQQKSAQN